MSKSVALFVEKLYANSSVHWSLLTEIVNGLKNITSYVETLKLMCAANETTQSTDLKKMFDTFQNAFIDHSTEDQSLSYFQNCKTLILPEKFNVDGDMQPRLSAGKRHTDHDFSFVPLKKILKQFLELPLVFENILSSIEQAEKSKEFISSNIRRIVDFYRKKNFGNYYSSDFVL